MAKKAAAAKPNSLTSVLTNYLAPATPEFLGIGKYSEKTLTVKDAEDIGAVLAKWDLRFAAANMSGEDLHGKLQTLIGFFSQVPDGTVGGAMLDHVLPHMFRLYDQWRTLPSFNEFIGMFFVRIFGLTRTEEGTARVIDAARSFPDNFVWTIVFPVYEEEHGWMPMLLDGLYGDLPEGFCGVAFLDLCNVLVATDQAEVHPFDTPAGRQRLRELLQNHDPDASSHANSAARAISFLGDEGRRELLEAGMAHPDVYIRLQTAKAGAKFDKIGPVRYLVRMCMDVNYTLAAQQCLRELEMEDRIPDETGSGDFLATALLSDYLQIPDNFSVPPDTLEMLDKRVLYWPPTRDTRTVWLFEYGYGKGKKAVRGVGMVGSEIASLRDETTPKMDPEDIYALHCCWELEQKNDKRAPKKRTVAAGRKLLGLGRKRA